MRKVHKLKKGKALKINFKLTGDYSVSAICIRNPKAWFMGSFDSKEVTCKRCLKIMAKVE